MVDSASGKEHSTDDEVLSVLTRVAGAIGEFVSVYPGTETSHETDWLDSWFRERTKHYFCETESGPEDIQMPVSPAASAYVPVLAQPIRLVSVQPHYFRGFRDTAQPVSLEGDLIVIDGRNTSGKTSLAEALEWLFTGRLSRRESMELGSPHELENCVSNEFCPEDDETWVTATFVSLAPEQTEPFSLRRVLKEDYGRTLGSKCTSLLLMDDEQLSHQQEIQLLDALFASEPPLLMQHTLRLFVESEPRKRRQYFERLLHLDGLTDLISRAVVGDARLPEFPSPAGGVGLNTWDSLGSMVEAQSSQSAYKRASRADASDLGQHVRNALTAIAHHEFGQLVTESSEFEKIGPVVAREQSKFRQESFPLLAQLTPKRQMVEDHYQRPHDGEALLKTSTAIREAWRTYETAEVAARSIGADRRAVAKALKILRDANVIQDEADTQTCPICSYDKAETLTAARITEIAAWLPTQDAETAARTSLLGRMKALLDMVRKAVVEYDELLPPVPSTPEFQEALKSRDSGLGQALEALWKVRQDDEVQLGKAISDARELLGTTLAAPTGGQACEAYLNRCAEILAGLEDLPSAARRYRDAVRVVEAAVGALAKSDPAYRLRGAWLDCYDSVSAIVADLRWEQAKRRAQKELASIRAALMDFRRQFLESRRVSFNEGIDSVWNALRADRYSAFSKLHIPEPSGRGFPVEIEIKAVLDDGQQRKEVDALRVFSESQVNALGIAAFVTRSKLLGHKTLVFDDPVQSMDEEHFKTFAQDVLTHVLGEGFQVILLTHNDMFARDVSNCHYDHPGYVTMSLRLSKTDGCVVEEGNRRFSERLRLAERRIDNGDLKKAWELLREAIERLYTVVYIKHGPVGFNPDSWRDQTAEYMWNSGVGDIINDKIPDIGPKLRDIQGMTAAGGHDKAPRGETDLRNAVKFLGSLPSKLAVGG